MDGFVTPPRRHSYSPPPERQEDHMDDYVKFVTPSDISTVDDEDEEERWEEGRNDDDDDIETGPDELEEREQILKDQLLESQVHINQIQKYKLNLLKKANMGVDDEDTGDESSDTE